MPVSSDTGSTPIDRDAAGLLADECQRRQHVRQADLVRRQFGLEEYRYLFVGEPDDGSGRLAAAYRVDDDDVVALRQVFQHLHARGAAVDDDDLGREDVILLQLFDGPAPRCLHRRAGCCRRLVRRYASQRLHLHHRFAFGIEHMHGASQARVERVHRAQYFQRTFRVGHRRVQQRASYGPGTSPSLRGAAFQVVGTTHW